MKLWNYAKWICLRRSPHWDIGQINFFTKKWPFHTFWFTVSPGLEYAQFGFAHVCRTHTVECKKTAPELRNGAPNRSRNGAPNRSWAPEIVAGLCNCVIGWVRSLLHDLFTAQPARLAGVTCLARMSDKRYSNKEKAKIVELSALDCLHR